jgi:ubiquinone/menaquinone biosynthesis C-methylase UbiE
MVEEAEGYRCGACAAVYPIVLGIPDFRVLADPWISIEDDRAKARRLAERTAGRDFAATVREYWAMTSTTPSHLAERYTAHVLAAEQRVSEWLHAVEPNEALSGDGFWLDIGCGTADLIAAAVKRGHRLVGVDIALRWLVAARKRLDELGLDATLVCADGEHLPFADGMFARVFSLGTLEHCQRADRVIAEARRVSASRGIVRVRTVNRYSLLPEPHVRVWGVGFVPRVWRDSYVQWRSGQRYQHHRPLSPRELARAMRGAQLRDVEVLPARLLAEERARIPQGLRWAARVYDRCRTLPLGGTTLAWVAPILEARGVAP